MGSAIVCRLCENGAVPDPTAQEIIAHRGPGHRRGNANPYWCSLGSFRHKGQMLDRDHLCRPHRQQIDGAPGHADLQESAAGITAGSGSPCDTSLDAANSPAMEVLPRLGLHDGAESI